MTEECVLLAFRTPKEVVNNYGIRPRTLGYVTRRLIQKYLGFIVPTEFESFEWLITNRPREFEGAIYTAVAEDAPDSIRFMERFNFLVDSGIKHPLSHPIAKDWLYRQ